MKVDLAYGHKGLTVDLPEQATVILPRHQTGLPDEQSAFVTALRNPIGTRPLREMIKAEEKVVIVISDMTRPTPNDRMVPWVLAELAHVPRSNFLILNGTGTHRPNTPEELERMLTKDVVDTVKVINHNGFDDDEIRLVGRTEAGGDIYLNRHYLDADKKVVIGFIEPHFFAGFSGGPKGVCPGVAGVQTIKRLHSAKLIRHPKSTWGVLDGNPIHEGVSAAVRLAPPDFIVNVVLNREKEITAVYAGDWVQAHRAGCKDCAEHAMLAVNEPFDILITTNSGYPLDQNLYQTVKGMSAAAQITKPGGTIIIASECSDGIPDHGHYGEILQMRQSPEALLQMIESPEFDSMDQWQVQIQALIQTRTQVYLYSGLPDDVVRRAQLQPIHNVEEALRQALERHGANARIGVLPMGPLTAPYIKVG